MDEVRRQLLAGKKIKACTACYDAEGLSGSSQRTQYNHYWKERVPGLMDRIRDRQEKATFEKPLSVDIRFGNPLQPALPDMQPPQQHADRA
jgi:hypothetical protein